MPMKITQYTLFCDKIYNMIEFVYLCSAIVFLYMKEEKYLDAIIEIWKVEGVELSMDAIADKIGVTRKTLYNRFKSKDDLLDRCLQRLSSGLSKAVDYLVDESIDVVQGFEKGITGMWMLFNNASYEFTRDMLRLYPRVVDNQYRKGKALLANKIRSNIERGQSDGTYRSDIDADLMSRYISFSIFVFFHNELRQEKDLFMEASFNKIVDFNVHALLAVK